MQSLPLELKQKNYTIIEELGKGASSICFHITSQNKKEHYALKKIPLDFIEVKKLNNQINILRSISHPNFIKFTQSYRSKLNLFLLFQYNYEKDLQKIIKDQEKLGFFLSEKLIWKILRKILEGLQYLHEKGIIHRDIKPSNIFVNLQKDIIHIGDMGTAKIMESQNYSRIGTPLYLPPEIIKYESYSQNIDIWSLGVTIFYLAALKPPFQSSNILKLSQKICYQDPIFPDHFSEKLKNCIQKMLTKQYKDRPSAANLLQEYFEKQFDLKQSQTQAFPQQIQSSAKNITKRSQEQKDLFVKSIKKLSNKLIDTSKKQSEDFYSKFQQKKILNRLSSTKTFYKEDSIKQKSKICSLMRESDTTIVLQLNPNDFNNFCGYYRESPRPSRIHFNDINNGSQQFKMGRKSTLFKNLEENQIIGQPSQFKTSGLQFKKENMSNNKITHRRQESAIKIKQKHGELMGTLKRSHHYKCYTNISKQLQIRSPQLVVIDKKPLLHPISNI